jgi:hypothetical protein
MNEHMAQRWFKRFASGNLSLEDEQRPRGPWTRDSEATKEAAEQPSTSTCRLSDMLGPSRLQRVLFIATQQLQEKFTRAVELYPMT